MKPILAILFFVLSCAGVSPYRKTVPDVELEKFMGKWYVIASRATSYEKNAFQAVEIYTFNKDKDRIDIDFTFRKGSMDGEKKSLPQKGYVIDKKNNSHWKVSPLWPLKFDYLIIGLDKDYKWTAIGVPDKEFLWIMAREPSLSETELSYILKSIESNGYPTQNMDRIQNKKD